jgi:hypothetical protein
MRCSFVTVRKLRDTWGVAFSSSCQLCVSPSNRSKLSLATHLGVCRTRGLSLQPANGLVIRH